MTTSTSSRPEGRPTNALRLLHAEQGLLNRADGSARFSMGRTTVLAAVFGPVQMGIRSEQPEKAVIEVTISSSEKSSGSAHFLQAQYLIKGALESVVLTSLHPRTVIRVAIQVIESDGSLISAGINAACFALLDAGVPCTSLITSCTIAVAQNGVMLYDPDNQEEVGTSCRIITAFQSDADGKNQLALVYTEGILPFETFEKAVKAGEKACVRLRAFIKMAIEKKIQTTTILI